MNSIFFQLNGGKCIGVEQGLHNHQGHHETLFNVTSWPIPLLPHVGRGKHAAHGWMGVWMGVCVCMRVCVCIPLALCMFVCA